MRPRFRPLTTLLLAFALGAGAAPARAAEAIGEDTVAAFLLNFISFATWPGERFESDRSPFRLCVVANDPVVRALQARGSVERGGRPVRVLQLSTGVSLDGCHLVFIGHLDRRLASEQLGSDAGQQVLAVGLGEAFLESGGTIALQHERGRVRMKIRLEAARRARIALSSKLLELADIVREPQ